MATISAVQVACTKGTVNVPVNVVGPVDVTLTTVPLPTQPVVAGMTIVGPPPRVSLAVTLTVTTSPGTTATGDRKSTRLNSSHVEISYAVFCLKKKKTH